MKSVLIAFGLILSSFGQSVTKSGEVLVTVLSDYVSQGELNSTPLGGVGVYADDWQKGNILGYTDDKGKLLITVPAGVNKLSVFKMTSSHSILQSYDIEVIAISDQLVEKQIHVAAEQVLINAYYNTQYGEALYLTGDSHYLGNWQRAVKLQYNANSHSWSYYGNLPLGAEFKIIKGLWVDERSIDTDDVKWESGLNHTIEKTVGYYETIVEVAPQF